MNILSFGRRTGREKPPAASDWTNQELADFYRAHRLLVQNGASIGIDRGRSDIGEPWMIFFDVASQDVFLHIARIDRKCILVCDHLQWHFSASSVTDLIANLEVRLRDQFAVRAAADPKVVLHPAAKVILSISAVFLLFKMDNSSAAYAKEAAAFTGADGTSRKVESQTHTGRAHNVVSRLFEGADTPIAIAALAGVILAWDLMEARSEPELYSSHQDEKELALTHAGEETSTAKIVIKTEKIADIPIILPPHPAPLAPASDLTPNTTTAHAEVVLVSEKDVAPHWNEHQFTREFTPTADLILTTATNAERSGEAVIAQQSAPTTWPAQVLTASLSVQVISDVIALDIAQLGEGQLSNGLIMLPDGGLTFPTGGADELVAYESGYGFSAHTALEGDEFMSILKHIVSGLGAFELEEENGNLWIEQAIVKNDTADTLGLWSNVMSDGSTITIVGQIGLMDDVAWALPGAWPVLA